MPRLNDPHSVAFVRLCDLLTCSKYVFSICLYVSSFLASSARRCSSASADSTLTGTRLTLCINSKGRVTKWRGIQVFLVTIMRADDDDDWLASDDDAAHAPMESRDRIKMETQMYNVRGFMLTLGGLSRRNRRGQVISTTSRI